MEKRTARSEQTTQRHLNLAEIGFIALVMPAMLSRVQDELVYGAIEPEKEMQHLQQELLIESDEHKLSQAA